MMLSALGLTQILVPLRTLLFALTVKLNPVFNNWPLVDLTNFTFEKFKRVRVGGTTISEIISVYDSEGNRYYEVDNLSQEVVFVDTTNKNAHVDGVRSILKPFATTRRFTVEQDNTGTYLPIWLWI